VLLHKGDTAPGYRWISLNGWAHRAISHRVRDTGMAQVVLEPPGIHTRLREGEPLAAGESNPLFKVQRPPLASGQKLIHAALRAELLMRKPVADKTEAAVAYFTARLSLCDRGIRIFAHALGSACAKTIGSCVARNSLIVTATAIFYVNLTC
jgi:hypothetical protein